MRVFTEIQKFDQWWLKLLMFLVFGTTFVPIILSYSDVAPDELNSFLLTVIPVALITVAVSTSIFFIKLKTKIDESGIHYGFWPFQKNLRTAYWHEIDSCYVRKYKPITEFGGWGYKFSLKNQGKVYNTKGNMGVQIVFKNSTRTLVGTQKPEEAQRMIDKFTSKATLL